MGKTTKHGKCRFRTQVVTRSMRQQSVHITYQPTRRAAAKLCSRKEFNSSRLFPFRDIVRLRSTTQTAVSAPIGIVRARPVIPLEYLSSSRLADLHITPWRSSNEHTQGENARRASTCTGWTRGALSQPELLAPLPPFRRAAWITAVREEYGAAHVKLRSGEMQTAQTHDILRACSSAVRLLGVDYEQMHCCRKYMMHRSLVQAQCSMGLLIRVLRPQIMK